MAWPIDLAGQQLIVRQIDDILCNQLLCQLIQLLLLIQLPRVICVHRIHMKLGFEFGKNLIPKNYFIES